MSIHTDYSKQALHAGDFNDEEAHNGDTDKYDVRKVKVPCPHCGNIAAPLRSPNTERTDGGWRWVGDSHMEPYTSFKSQCRKCKRPYVFTVYTAQ
jgi:hypothetical protein